jgi:hypothetical protein
MLAAGANAAVDTAGDTVADSVAGFGAADEVPA